MDPSSPKRGSLRIRPTAIMATSGKFSTGQPNFPPMAPMLLKVIVPSVMSSVVSLLFDANFCNLDSSIVIWQNKACINAEVGSLLIKSGAGLELETHNFQLENEE